MSRPHTCALHSVLSPMRANGEFADVTISCEGTQMKLHKVIICTQSRVLYKAFTGGFKETNEKTYQTEDDDPLIFSKMIEFFYTGDYSAVTSTDGEKGPLTELDLHAKVFALADKYDAQSLGERAVDHYRHRLKTCDGNEFMISIATVYQNTPPTIRSLRNVSIQYAQAQLQRTARRQEDVRDALLEIVQAIPEFAKDICEAWIKNPTQGSCSNCGPAQALEILQARCRSCGRGGASVDR